VSLLPLVAGLRFPRHVDPAELREEPPLPSMFFLLYSRILGSLASEDWDRVVAELGEAIYLHAPPDLRFIISRFNELLEEGAEDLSRVKLHAGNASVLIERSRLSEARDELEEAEFLLARSNRTVNDLESSATQLGIVLGASPAPLLEEIVRLRGLIDSYAVQIWDLLERVREFQSGLLVETVLTIQADALKVPLGSELSVWGFLTTVDSRPLSSKAVDIYFDGAKMGDVTTDDDGSYSFWFSVPYVYKDRVVLHSSYLPRDLDFGRYVPSSSDVLVIELRYDKPVLTAEAPRHIYPSLSFAASGRLTLYGKPLSGFDVRVSGLGQVIEAVTETDGSFLTDFQVPLDAPSGGATLRVEAAPRGIVGPASVALALDVVRVPAVVEVEAPGFALSGQSLTIKGKVITSDGSPLVGSRVDIRFGEWSSSAVSSGDGSFEFVLGVPLVAFTAQYAYMVLVSPKEPWITSSLKEGGVFIANVLSICAAPLLGATLTFAWRRGRRKREYEMAPLVGQEEAPQQGARAVEARKLVSVQAQYWKAVTVVSKWTGVAMDPSLTIREYLELVREKLMGAYASFERLSLLYERWLYSPLRGLGEKSLAERCFRELVWGLRPRGLQVSWSSYGSEPYHSGVP